MKGKAGSVGLEASRTCVGSGCSSPARGCPALDHCPSLPIISLLPLFSTWFLLMFFTCSLLTFLPVLFFFLRSKAERKSLLFCQWKGVLRRRFPGKHTADPCAPTELSHLSLHGRCAAFLPGSFACISHSSSGHSFRVQSPL